MFLQDLRAAAGTTINMKGVLETCCHFHTAIECRLRQIGGMEAIEAQLVAIIQEVVSEAAKEGAVSKSPALAPKTSQAVPATSSAGAK